MEKIEKIVEEVEKLSKQILDDLANPEHEGYAFIQQDERFQKIMKQYKEKGCQLITS